MLICVGVFIAMGFCRIGVLYRRGRFCLYGDQMVYFGIDISIFEFDIDVFFIYFYSLKK